MSANVAIEFGLLFKRFQKPSIIRFFKRMSREQIVMLAISLNNDYSDRFVIDLLGIIGREHPKYNKILRSLLSVITTSNLNKVQYVVCTKQLSLELLRYAFFYSYKINDGCIIDSKSRYTFLKILTAINENLNKISIDKASRADISKLCLVKSMSNNDITSFDYQNEFNYQFCQASQFFSFIEDHEKFRDLYKLFLSYYSIDDWRQYVYTVLSLSYLASNGVNVIPGDLSYDKDHLIDRNVLEKLCIPIDVPSIKMHAKNEFDNSGNSDYRCFRDTPVIKGLDGNYFLFSSDFLINRLYSGLYFDFLKVARSKEKSDVIKLFTSDFVEKTLFCSLIEKCFNELRYDYYNENSLLKNRKYKKLTFSIPDFISVNKHTHSTILFECKDIRINSYIKEQRNYTLLEEELRNKLVLAEWSRNSQKEVREMKRKRQKKGVGQLATLVAAIRNGEFRFIRQQGQHVPIYSVLMISDNRMIQEGLSLLLQQWYEERLKKEGIKTNENRLIVMSPLCLLLYHDLFNQYGMESFFQEYYNSLPVTIENTIDCIHHYVSFEDYMMQYDYDLTEYGIQWLDELRQRLN